MSFIEEKCSRVSLRMGIEQAAHPFSCGDEELDDFFLHDFIPFEEELMGKSYCYITDYEPHIIVAAFTLCNGSIHNRMLTSGAKKRLNENVSEEKRKINFPAVLIGRLGVSNEFQGKNIGSDVMEIIKQWFVEADNKTGCRYLLVDAYNNEKTLNYYIRNGFNFLFPNFESEKKYRRLESVEGDLRTRLMYFDLILAKQQ